MTDFKRLAGQIIDECNERIADDWARGNLFFQNGVPLRFVANDPSKQHIADMLTKLENRKAVKEAS